MVLPLSMLLAHVEHRLAPKVGTDFADPLISGLNADSRRVAAGELFVAVRGSAGNGHDYIHDAVAASCAAVLVEEGWEGKTLGVPLVIVKDSRRALGLLAAEMHGHPAAEMRMIGITGTNGKTSCSYLIESELLTAGLRPGVIGTVAYRYTDSNNKMVSKPAALTTPEPVVLHALLREMAAESVSHVIMEVSSHALEQQRLAGIDFDLAAFTNLSRDHLDYHGDMESYFTAKKQLFEQHLSPDASCVIVKASENQDDYGQRLCRELEPARQQGLLCCGFHENDNLWVQEWEHNLNGVRCRILAPEGKISINSPLIGVYTVDNLLLAAGAGLALGLSPESIGKGLSSLDAVPGRLEEVRGGKNKTVLRAAQNQPRIFVDYAHTPAALENAAQTLKEQGGRRLLLVFGCGGDRDQGKRALMGAVAVRLAHAVVLTSDNPRSEKPEAILAAIEQGCIAEGTKRLEMAALLSGEDGYICIKDRQRAIDAAVAAAQPGDILLLAGKGHEDYQIIGKDRRFFDDRLAARQALINWNLKHLVRTTNAVALGKTKVLLANILTDSRKIQQGDIFVALHGDNFDGHNYCQNAVHAGAGCVIIDHHVPNIPDNIIQLKVKDTLQTLGNLAAYRRRLLADRLKIIAITGSSGKTTVKDMTAAIFTCWLPSMEGEEAFFKTMGNFNNLIGLPLSLLPASCRHEYGILEMGMNMPGEIARLTEIAAPDIACINNVQTAHLEGLGSIENIARAKGELFAGLKNDALLVVNLDDEHICRLAKKHPQGRVAFAVRQSGECKKADVCATSIEPLGAEGMAFEFRIGAWKGRAKIAAPGIHNVANAAAAAAIAHAAGVSPESILSGLAEYRPADRRMEVLTLKKGPRVLNDCYNANPASMEAALDTVTGFGTDVRHAALLGDMLELGEQAKDFHAAVGRLVAERGYNFLLAMGEYAPVLADAARAAGMASDYIYICRDHADAAACLTRLIENSQLDKEDWLLVKASRGMRLEKVVELLKISKHSG